MAFDPRAPLAPLDAPALGDRDGFELAPPDRAAEDFADDDARGALDLLREALGVDLVATGIGVPLDVRFAGKRARARPPGEAGGTWYPRHLQFIACRHHLCMLRAKTCLHLRTPGGFRGD